MEIWKNIKGYEGIYEVSNYGKIRNFKTKFVLNTKPKPDGYYRFGLWKNGKQKYHYLSRLVFSSFCNESINGLEINHIDCNRSNNKFENLEITTSRENNCHRWKTNGKKSSLYSGVCKAYDNKFRAYIFIDNKQKSLGYYKTELEAYQARVNFEKENSIINKYLV
jgi:hypothetical protein